MSKQCRPHRDNQSHLRNDKRQTIRSSAWSIGHDDDDVGTVKVPFSQPCFDHFFGPCFRGHDRGAPRLTEACPRHEDKARLTGTRIDIILWLGSLSHDWWCGSGTLWCLLDLQKYCCLSKLRQFWQKKVTAESHFRSCKTLALDSKKLSSPVALKNCCPTLIHLRHAKTFLCESLVRGCAVYWTTLNLLEHL